MGNAFNHVTGPVTINQILAPANNAHLAHAVVSPQVAGFATVFGRDGDLERLRAEFLSSGCELTAPVVRVLVGMGGVGKTSLARAYAQRNQANYRVVWWVRAEDPSAIDAEFRGLLEILLPPGEATHIRDARTSVFALLSRYQEPWLLVFDNTPDASAAFNMVPPAGGGHVLFTSRAVSWPDPHIVIPVRPLGMESATDLLTHLSLDDDPASAITLAAELGGLPLALTQAASFIRTNALDLSTYLRLYRDRRDELHREGTPAEYPHTVATTWRLALDQLSTTACATLNLLALYAPDAIPTQLLLAPARADELHLPTEIHPLLADVLTDELARHRAVGELVAYSLVTSTRDAHGGVHVHRLVQAVTRESLDADTRAAWADAAHALLIAVVPQATATAAALKTWTALHTHVRALLDHLPPNQEATLATRHILATWTGEAGNPAGARDLCAALLPLRKQVLGPEHPDTLATWQALTWWTGEAGDPAAARDLCAALLPASERALGTEHPVTLTTRRILARWTGESGNPEEARKSFSALLSVQERVLGTDHPDTLTTKHNLAYWIGHTGDAAGARDLYATVVPARERVLGTEHPSSVRAHAYFAYWIGAAGDAAGARDALAALLPIHERVVGAEHPLTLSIRHDLADWTGAAGDAAGARDALAALLPTQQKLLGGEHAHTMLTKHDLAYWTGMAGDAAGARDAFAELLPIRHRLLGPTHFRTLACRHQLARWTGEAGEANAARDALIALVPERNRVLGPEHPDALLSQHQLAHWTGAAGDPECAQAELVRLLAIQERVIGTHHPDTVATRDAVAYWTARARER